MASLQGGNGEKGKRKGMYTGKTTQKRRKDGKLKINFDKVTLRAIGHNHGTWARDLGLLARTHLPVRCEVPFNKLSDKVKVPIYEGMLERFDFVMLPNIKKAIDDQMKDSHRSWRCSLRKYFKKIGGEISPEIAKRLPPNDIINNADWEWLCDYWSTEEQIELSKQNMKNRLTNKGYNSSHGSKSYPAHREELMNLGTNQFVGDIEFHRVMYTNHKTKQWCNPQAEQDYNKMLALRDLQTHQSSDAISNGDTHHVPLTEEDIVQRVRKPRSGYIRGRGKILKGSSSSSGAQSENDEVVVELKNKLASYENKLDACTSFIEQLTSQLNMQFPGCFAQFDPRTTFSLPLPPQHPSQDDDDDDDAYRPVISRDPCY